MSLPSHGILGRTGSETVPFAPDCRREIGCWVGGFGGSGAGGIAEVIDDDFDVEDDAADCAPLQSLRRCWKRYRSRPNIVLRSRLCRQWNNA